MAEPRVSLEWAAADDLLRAIGSLPPGVVRHGGLATDNRVQPVGWHLAPQQRFQFGDLRLEDPGVRVVVEIESAGGETNLVKYWPMLDRGLRDKRFVLVHLFRVMTAGDYAAHRDLWGYLLDRMRSDLDARCGLRWERDWHAALFTYGPAARPPSVAEAAHSVDDALRRVTVVQPSVEA